MTACTRCGSMRGDVRRFLDTPATCRHATVDDCIGALRDDLESALGVLRESSTLPRVHVDVSRVVSDAINDKLRAFADDVAEVERENKRLRIRWARVKAYAGKPSQPPMWSNPLADLLIEIEADDRQ